MGKRKNKVKSTDELTKNIEEAKKPYVQFSKKIIALLVGNLLIIELFVMFIIYTTSDTSSMPYLITGIAATMGAGIIWYLKNSEAEKKARISAEVERMKLQGKVPKEAFDVAISTLTEEVNKEPDTYYKESFDSGVVDTNIVVEGDPLVESSYVDDGAVG